MAPIALSDLESSPAPIERLSDTDVASYKAYDHVHWYVGNAKQAAAFFITRMGFEKVAYKGLETGSRTTASHVVRNGDVTFVFTSPLRSLKDLDRHTPEEQTLLKEIHAHLEAHGDAVKGEKTITISSVIPWSIQADKPRRRRLRS
jgi:4-hydroxyphenylpyruvate dioxygenase